jgi:hypothetical protein
MHRLLLALAFLVLASSAQAFETWANKRGSMISIRSLYPGYEAWSDDYSSNELTTQPYCRNQFANYTLIYKYPNGRWPWWDLRWPPLTHVLYDFEMYSVNICAQELYLLARRVERPRRLCAVWVMRDTDTGKVFQGNDVFWPVPDGSILKVRPYPWPRGSGVKRSSCPPAPTKRLNVNGVIRPAPKNYPVWPPFFGPVWR